MPFPRLHYLTASYAPLLPRDFGGGAAAAPDRGGGDDRARLPRHVQRLFADAASPLSRLVATYDAQPARPAATLRAGKESEIPNFKGSELGRFPLVSADFWTSDHLLKRSRSVDAFSGTRVRGTRTLKRR